jgi:hypothetical protein
LGFFKEKTKMGRPLKIQKYSTGSGNGGAAVAVDQAYPPFAAPTSMDTATSTYPTGGTNPPWLGVVGGVRGGGVSTTYPVVKVEVNITNSYSGQAAGVILRQKGSHKFLVATTASIDPANAVAGVALRITAVGNTNWTAMGLSTNETAAIGTIFTPTAASAGGTNGTAQEVGVCVLTSDLTPSAGNMSISYFAGAADSTEQAISKLTNRFLQNFAGGATGGNANTGDVWAYTAAVDNVVLDANFFTDEGTVTKSGADTETWGANGSEQNAGGTLDLGIVENYTS